jgi:hypothetical protein
VGTKTTMMMMDMTCTSRAIVFRSSVPKDFLRSFDLATSPFETFMKTLEIWRTSSRSFSLQKRRQPIRPPFMNEDDHVKDWRTLHFATPGPCFYNRRSVLVEFRFWLVRGRTEDANKMNTDLVSFPTFLQAYYGYICQSGRGEIRMIDMRNKDIQSEIQT